MASERARVQAVRLLAQFEAASLDAFATDTRAELERRGFVVRDAAPSGWGAGCSVAGSFQAGPPPVITVAADRSQGRRRFTALHEFGHSLIEADDEIHDLLFQEPDQGERLVEDVCDAIAAELLLPEALVDDYLDPRGPTGRAVLNLFRGSNASREATCVRAAQRIRGEGHVMLARDGVAVFTSSRSTPFRVRRESVQGDDHITSAAGSRGQASGSSSVVYHSGAPSDRYHADAVADEDGYVFAVFVADRPAWEQDFTLIVSSDTDPVEVECPTCEEQFTTLASPCGRCGDYVHERGCGRCSCAASAERLCGTCFNRKAAHLFSSATADNCIDCGGE